MSILDEGGDALGRVRAWRVVCDHCGVDIEDEDYHTPGPEDRRSAVVVVKDSKHLNFEGVNFFIHFTSMDSKGKHQDLCGKCILRVLERAVRALAAGKVKYERDLRKLGGGR